MTSLTPRNFGLAAGMVTAVALTAGALISFSADASPSVEAGMVAPAFTDAMTSSGEAISIADFSGKTIVLEWTNHGCPFVQKHYAEPVKNMQTLQADAVAGDVIWVAVISSAPGKQGYVGAMEADVINAERGSTPAYTILDPDGDLGRAYGAKTTPHMFVITEDGVIAYDGAIDSIRSAKVADIAEADNYVAAALTSVVEGAPVEIASTKPYGCSVKY